MVTDRSPIATALFAITCIAAMTLMPTSPARPCGAFLSTETDTNAGIGAQRALYVLGAERVDLHLQLTGDASNSDDFAWIFPIPAKGGKVGTSDGLPTLALSNKAIFAALETVSAPAVTIVRAGGDNGGGGIGCDDATSLGGGDDRSTPVEHFGTGTLGPYTWDILAGGDAEAIAAWLVDAGYRLPAGFAEAIGPWTASSRFVAVRLTPAPDATARTLEPLVITFDRPTSTSLLYPFSISRLSTADRAPFVIWTLADKRQRVLNYGSVDVTTVATAMRDEDLNYNDAVRRLTDGADGRLVVTEFARDLRGFLAPAALQALVDDERFYLTRLFGDIPREFMEDLAISHAPNAPEVEPEVIVTAAALAFEMGRTAGGPLLVLLVIALVFRRQRFKR